MTKSRKADLWSGVSVVIVLLFLLFLIYPLFNIFKEAMVDKTGQISFAQFTRFFADPYYTQTILNSLKVTVLVTLGCVLIGLPFSYFYSFYDLKGTKFLFVASLLCCMSAPFIGAYA